MTGQEKDGIIFICPVEDGIRIHTDKHRREMLMYAEDRFPKRKLIISVYRDTM